MKISVKRFLPLIMALAVVLSSLPQGIIAQETNDTIVSVAQSPSTDFDYTVANSQVEITGYVGDAKEVGIPTNIQGYPVTKIGNSAFYNCSSVVRISIPDSVKTIGNSAFLYCSSLEEITIPDSVTSIGNSAFSYCTSLTTITLPPNITEIGFDTFYQCSSLTEITIPNGVKTIGNSAFGCCELLEKIEIPDSVTKIDNSAFVSCSTLTTVTIKEGVKSIGKSAFKGCFLLESITLPDSLESIGDSAFKYCYSLLNINIPEKVISIGIDTFYDCSSLTDITISESVTSIGNSAFNGCESLTNVNYTGNESKWNAIDISNAGNDYMLNANIRLEYVPGEEGSDENIPESSILTGEQIIIINNLLCEVSDDYKNMSAKELNQKIADYAAYAFDLEVTDTKAIALCINIIFIGGESEIVRVLAKTTDYSLDGIYAALLTDTGAQVGMYKSRNWKFYKNCVVSNL